MNLDETAWRHFDNLYAEKQEPLRETHVKTMQAIETYTLWPYEPGSTRHLREVQPNERLLLLVDQIKDYAREVVIAFSDAFIKVHRDLDQHPDENDTKVFWERISKIPERCIGDIEELYKSPHSPFKNEVFVNRVFEHLHNELKEFPGRYAIKVNTFLTGSALRKRQNLPLNDPVHASGNTVYIGGDARAPIQVGTDYSSQNVSALPQRNELTEDQKDQASTKISEFLLSKQIWKGEWISYKDISENTDLEIWIVKDWIKHSAFLAHLIIYTDNPDGVLLVSSFGKT